MVATFQPDPTQEAVELAESAVSGRLQMQPVIARVMAIDDQVKPASSFLAGFGAKVLFPANSEMAPHLTFPELPMAEAAECRSDFVVHNP